MPESSSETRPVKWTSFSARLRNEIDELERLSEQLIGASGIEYRGDFNRGGSVVFIAPDWAWTDPTDELRRLQTKLLPRFDQWRQRYSLLFRTAPKELQKQVNETTGRVRVWLARDGGGWTGWDIPEDITKAKRIQSERFAKLRHLLDVIAPETPDQDDVIALPDTSSLIDVPDLHLYGTALGVASVRLVLVPSVLSELDALKDQGKTQEVREKARRAIGAIKAVRERGSLLHGVELENGVCVVSRPQEPRFDDLPGHLDRSVPDDRLLAAAFELQRDHPTASVVLVTGDVNLQTKAEFAQIPFAEPPRR